MFIRHQNRFAGQNPVYRTAVVWDRQGTATPTFTDIFRDDTGIVGELPLAGINLKNRERFTILYDNINSMHRNAKYQAAVKASDTTVPELIIRDGGESYIDLGAARYQSVFEETDTVPTTGQLLLVTIANTINRADDTAVACQRYFNVYIRMRYTDA